MQPCFIHAQISRKKESHKEIQQEIVKNITIKAPKQISPGVKIFLLASRTSTLLCGALRRFLRKTVQLRNISPPTAVKARYIKKRLSAVFLKQTLLILYGLSSAAPSF